MSTKKVTKVWNLRSENHFKLDPEFVLQYVNQQPNWGYGLISYITFKRTYARPVTKVQLIDEAMRYLGLNEAQATDLVSTSTQTSEEYWQTVVRVVEGHSSILKQHVRDTGQPWSDAEEQHHAQEMFRRIWSFKFTPPGRGFWTMGTEVMELKGSGAANNCGFVSTDCMNLDFSRPFCELMDWSMLGVGVGFDMLGAKHEIHLVNPSTDPIEAHVVEDTREGWIDCVRRVLEAYVGKSTLPASWDYSKIRKEGKPLKTFGGTASGYKPLETLIKSIIRICEMYYVSGLPVDSSFITDVQNHIGKCVVAGNIRRSSEIAIGSPDDAAFRALKDNKELYVLFSLANAAASANPKWLKLQRKIDKLKEGQVGLSVLDSKYSEIQVEVDKLTRSQKRVLEADGNWSQINEQINAHPLMSHRWASNNSVLGDTVGNYDELASSTALNGEPGYAWLENMRAYGRMADPPNWKDKKAVGTNPCVIGSTLITIKSNNDQGFDRVRIDSLVGQEVDVWNGVTWSKVTPVVTGEHQPVATITLSDGRSLTCTAGHRWLQLIETNFGVEDVIRTDAWDLKEGDVIANLPVPGFNSTAKSVHIAKIEAADIADKVYCFTEYQLHQGTFNDIVTGQCAEQTLHDGELCNLVESYPAKHDSLEDFLTTIKYAYRYAKSVTLVPTHNSRTNAVMVRNRRIGMSMAGVIELYERLGMTECTRWWDEGYKEVCKWDTEYSSWLGVNESIKKTSIKPGGSVPLLAGLEGGMKSPISEYYMRTIRIGYQSPLVAALRDAGYRVEPDRTTPRTEVVYFPQRAPEGVRTANDISLWEQAAIFTNLQKYWSDNMVSATLMFKKDEAKDISKILMMYEKQWKGVSFLPLDNHGYLQAPYIPCTKEEYELAVSKLKPLQIDGLTVSHDQDEKFCSGALCEMAK